VSARRRWLGLATGLTIALGPIEAAGEQLSPNVAIGGYAQVWFTVYEEMEDLRGLYQYPSGDEAATVTSGFRVSAARVSLKLTTEDQELGLVTRVRLEENPGLLDLYGCYRPVDWFGIRLGQFKVPSVYENLQEASTHDFVTRTQLAKAIADYSLSRTTHASSLFFGNRSFQRDLGLGLEGELSPGGLGLRYFAMVGNGLGGGLFIGGNTDREYVIANEPGHWLYTGRLEFEPLAGVLTIGGHGSYNHHGDVVFNSGRAVIDVERASGSADVQLQAKAAGLRAVAAVGGGENLDDWDDDGLTDYVYLGAEWRLLWCLNPALRAMSGWPATDDHSLELGFRYDVLQSEMDESEEVVRQHSWTPAVTYRYRDYVKVQLNGLLRRTDAPFQPRLADDALLLAVQGAI
jgi:hypothetical protein